jgi:hypothetical protein
MHTTLMTRVPTRRPTTTAAPAQHGRGVVLVETAVAVATVVAVEATEAKHVARIAWPTYSATAPPKPMAREYHPERAALSS